MSLRSASQNAPVSARTRSRLESVLKAGIATNAGDGGSSKRANLSDESSNIAMLNEDLLLKILVKAVDDNDPCGSLEDLCLIDKEASTFCEDGRLYDEVNKKLGWYGDYRTLTTLNASKEYSPLLLFDVAQSNFTLAQHNIFNLLQEKAYGQTPNEFSSKGWFMFSCQILKNLSQSPWDLRATWKWLHPAFKTLLRQYLTTYLANQIERPFQYINGPSGWRLPYYVDFPTSDGYLEDWELDAYKWLDASKLELKKLIRVLHDDDDDKLEKQFEVLSNLWDAFTNIAFFKRRNYPDNFVDDSVFSNWFESVLKEIFDHTFLFRIFKWKDADINYPLERTAKYYGTFVMLSGEEEEF